MGPRLLIVDGEPVTREFSVWSDPLPLPSILLDVPGFEPGMLPKELRPWAVDIAERMNVPLEMVAVPAMIAAGSLIGSKIGIRPEANTDWTEVANLWGVVVAPPSAMKTPVFEAAFAPLKRLEAKAAEKNRVKKEEYELQCEVHRLQREAADKEAKKQIQGSCAEEIAELLARCRPPERPPERRFFTNDATVEKLAEICGDNPAGVLCYRDEAITLLQDLDREEKATARGFFLGGWGGKSSYTVDRIGRGTVRIDRVCISFAGTTQPDKIRGYLAASLRDRNDGMVQRLQLLVWPDFKREWKPQDRHPDTPARHRAFACYERLADLEPASVGAESDPFDDGKGIPFLRFSAAALATFEEWRAELEARLRDPDLPPHLEAHLGKYRGLIPKLALVIHLANGDRGPVSEAACIAALAWADYLEAHARRAYDATAGASTDTAKALVRRIQKGDLKSGFTARDVYRRKWSKLGNAEQVNAALELLEEYDHAKSERVITAGRPTTVWHINPACLT